MVEIRKLITTRETIFSELGAAAPRAVVRAVGIAVIVNHLAGRFVDDLRPLFEAGAMLGERLMPGLVKLLDGPAISYGKGALVGVNGEMEQKTPAWPHVLRPAEQVRLDQHQSARARPNFWPSGYRLDGRRSADRQKAG